MASEALPIPGLYLDRTPRALHVWSDAPLAVLSSAVAGAGLTQTRHILNMGVASSYHSDRPGDDLEKLARDLGLDEPFVGMMTAARLERAQVVAEQAGRTTVVAVVTVGLSRPVAAGVTEAFAPAAGPGTINMILVIEAQLAAAATVNAVITATEAKALALIEGGVRAPHGGPASGTGTDSIVLAWTGRGERFEYAGPVSPVGALVARAVRRAIAASLHK
jgi:iron complex transport system ATP-binding protein